MGNCGSSGRKPDATVVEPATNPTDVSLSVATATPPAVATTAQISVEQPQKQSSNVASDRQAAERYDAECKAEAELITSRIFADAITQAEAVASQLVAADKEVEQQATHLTASALATALSSAQDETTSRHEEAAKSVQAGCRGAMARQRVSHLKAMSAAPPTLPVPPGPEVRPTGEPPAAPATAEPPASPATTEAAASPTTQIVQQIVRKASRTETPPPPPPQPAAEAPKPEGAAEGGEAADGDATGNEWLSSHLNLHRSQSSMTQKTHKKKSASKGKKGSRAGRNSKEGKEGSAAALKVA